MLVHVLLTIQEFLTKLIFLTIQATMVIELGSFATISIFIGEIEQLRNEIAIKAASQYDVCNRNKNTSKNSQNL